MVDAAAETGVSLATLQEAVNLLLLNAGMEGGRDLGVQANIQLSSDKQKLQYPDPKYTSYSCDIIQNNLNCHSFVLSYLNEQAQQNNQSKGL